MPDSDDRGNNDPKPAKPGGDDPRSGAEMKSLLGSGAPKPSNKQDKPKKQP